MSQNIKEFSSEFENKLDRAYKSGAANKFGYNSVSSLANSNEEDAKDREDWKIKKIAN